MEELVGTRAGLTLHSVFPPPARKRAILLVTKYAADTWRTAATAL